MWPSFDGADIALDASIRIADYKFLFAEGTPYSSL